MYNHATPCPSLTCVLMMTSDALAPFCCVNV